MNHTIAKSSKTSFFQTLSPPFSWGKSVFFATIALLCLVIMNLMFHALGIFLAVFAGGLSVFYVMQWHSDRQIKQQNRAAVLRAQYALTRQLNDNQALQQYLRQVDGSLSNFWEKFMGFYGFSSQSLPKIESLLFLLHEGKEGKSLLDSILTLSTLCQKIQEALERLNNALPAYLERIRMTKSSRKRSEEDDLRKGLDAPLLALSNAIEKISLEIILEGDTCLKRIQMWLP